MQSSIASSSFLSYKVRQKLSESQSEKKSANQHCDFRQVEVVQNSEEVSLSLWIYLYDIFSQSPKAQSFSSLSKTRSLASEVVQLHGAALQNALGNNGLPENDLKNKMSWIETE